MSGLKNGVGGLAALQVFKIAPDEIDMYQIYHVLKPGTAMASMGTKNPATDGTATLLLGGYPDYPRNLLVTHDAAATVGGTLVVEGKNQFGAPISESFGIADAAGTRTQVAGTKVFGYVGTATWTSTAGTGGAGTVSIGYVAGTANNPKFGLPVPVAGSADIVNMLWIDNAVSKQLTEVVDATHSAFIIRESGGVNPSDDYIVRYKPTKDMSSKGEQTLL